MALENQRIQDFFRTAQKRDFTRDFQFRVLDISDKGASVVTQEDLVYAKTASLPARAITNSQAPYMGLQFNVPSGATYPGSEGYEITFYADGEHIIRSVFETWSQRIFDDSTSTGDYRLYDSSIITLAQLDQQFEVERLYKLYGCYPTNVGQLAYTMAAGTGAPLEFTATMAYSFWRRG